MNPTNIPKALKMICLAAAFCGTFLPLEAGKWDPLLEILWKNADEAIGPAMRAADTRLVEQAVLRHGDAAAEVFERGGYSFLKVVRSHGNQVVETAVRVPGSEAILTANPGFILGVVRRHGDNALRLEKEVPGFLETALPRIGESGLAKLLKAPPADRLYMAHLVKIADSPETARRLVSEYGRRGPEWLRKLPKTKIIVGSVLTAAVLDYSLRGEESLPDRALDKVTDFVWMLVRKVGLILLLVIGIPWLAWKILRRRIANLFQRRSAVDAGGREGVPISLRRRNPEAEPAEKESAIS